MSEGTGERRTLHGIPVHTYDEISAEYTARGIDIRDLAGSEGHFESWHRAKGLPVMDPDGKHIGSSQIFFRQYREDPRGEATCPPYIDFWHELLAATKTMPWEELPGRRMKTVPIGPQLWPDLPDPTEEELVAGRTRLEEGAGGALPDDAWAEVRRNLMLRRPRATRAREIATEIVERHGIDHPSVGRVVMIEMEVSC